MSIMYFRILFGKRYSLQQMQCELRHLCWYKHELHLVWNWTFRFLVQSNLWWLQRWQVLRGRGLLHALQLELLNLLRSCNPLFQLFCRVVLVDSQLDLRNLQFWILHRRIELYCLQSRLLILFRGNQLH